MTETANQVWAGRVREELVGNILPFWMRYTVDRENGGFYGRVDSNLGVDKQAERSCVVNTRILWTFATATRVLGSEYSEIAAHAYDTIANAFWDHKEGGLFWMVDWRGDALSARKQTYAQAFGIYALSEYFRATGNAASLDLAQRLFWLIDDESYDADGGGYIEARDRDWGELEDMRLSAKDMNSPKSMNTHLHVLEAYTNLLRVWRDPSLKARHAELLALMMDRVVDRSTGHFRMFFDEQWRAQSDHVSFGHDIEGSWLLVEAAEVSGDPRLIRRARDLAPVMADAVLKQGVDRDGSVFFEADGKGTLLDASRHWWVQAEAVVGFYNAYQISGEARFADAARRAWDFIENKVVDRVHGEWHARLTPEGTALSELEDPEACLAGPWKCPYHNARLCFEMMARLEEHGKKTP